jgi:hypothetical protein
MNYRVIFSASIMGGQDNVQTIYFPIYDSAMGFAHAFMRVEGPASVRVMEWVDTVCGQEGGAWSKEVFLRMKRD